MLENYGSASKFGYQYGMILLVKEILVIIIIATTVTEIVIETEDEVTLLLLFCPVILFSWHKINIRTHQLQSP